MASPAPVANAIPNTPTPTPKKKQPYPFYLGGLAATIAASITHPLDLTKVRLQASGDKRMIESMKKTVRTAGFRGLYDGITGTWMRQMSYSLCRFWAYDESKRILGANPQSPPWVLAAAGVMAGSIAGVVGNPGEVVMMVREEGPSSLVRGVGPNVFRSILMNSSQLASYDFFKSELLKTSYFEDNIYCHFTASFAAGTVATTVCSPADVLKSRIMNASGPGSSSTLGVIRASLANEGPMFMLKGWLPAWTRLQPTTILIFLTLEQLKRAVDWQRGTL
ncbi:mitochondrial carrier domain-containing protein [Lanmaoa asiatica]|nr:mitochondrial carrier domain-containing protein [Lanmaoa asiatica]